jgi:uncharacterized membrane protein
MRSVGHPYWLPLAILLALVAVYDDHETCEPGEDARFDFYIWNSNQSVIDLEVTVTNKLPGWTHEFYVFIPGHGSFTSKTSAKFRLEKDARATTRLTIYPLATALPGNYSMTLETVLQNGTDSKSKSFTLEMLRFVDANLREDYVPHGGFVGKPGAQVHVPIQLDNKGNGYDRFLIQVETVSNKSGWSAIITSGVFHGNWTPSVGPSDFSRINVSVRVPPNALAGDGAFIEINATSEADPKVIATFKVWVSTETMYSVEVGLLGENFQEVEGGNASEAVFKVEAINTGNVHNNVSVDSGVDFNLFPGFSIRVQPPWFVIPPGAPYIFDVTIGVPAGAPKREYAFWVFVTPETAEPEKITFYVKVGQFFGVEISSPNPRNTTDPGGVLDYVVKIKNVGNGLDSIQIELLDAPLGWLTYIQPPEVSLLMTEKANIIVRVIVPTRFEEAPMGNNIVTVRANSARSETTTAQIDLIIVINQFFRVEWTYGGLPITDPSAPRAQVGIIKPNPYLNPYGNNTWQVGWYGNLPALRNYGNSEVNVSVHVSTDEPRLEIECVPSIVRIPWSWSVPVRISISAPLGTPPGVYKVELMMACDDLPEFEPRILPLKARVFFLDLAVGPIDVTSKNVTVAEGHVNVTELRYVHIEYSIENLGTGAVADAKVLVTHITPRGERNDIGSENASIAPGGSDEYSYRWYAHEPGDHRFEIKVELDNQSNTDNDVGVLEVTVVELPKAPGDDDGWMEDWRSYTTGILILALLLVLLAMLRIGRASMAESRSVDSQKDEYSEGMNGPESDEMK